MCICAKIPRLRRAAKQRCVMLEACLRHDARGM